jgi:hypothetical protein
MSRKQSPLWFTHNRPRCMTRTMAIWLSYAHPNRQSSATGTSAPSRRCDPGTNNLRCVMFTRQPRRIARLLRFGARGLCGVKAGPGRTRDAGSGYPRQTKSRAFGPTVTTTYGPTAWRDPQVAICETSPATGLRPALPWRRACRDFRSWGSNTESGAGSDARVSPTPGSATSAEPRL